MPAHRRRLLEPIGRQTPKPAARQADLISEPIGDELLVFDAERQTAHSLNQVAAAVWHACDGTRDERAIADACDLTPETVALTLSELAAIDLLDGHTPPATGISRRQILRRAALTGAGVGLALPVIRSVVAPSTAAAAGSTCAGVPQSAPEGHSCTSTCECSTSASSCCCHSSIGSGSLCLPLRPCVWRAQAVPADPEHTGYDARRGPAFSKQMEGSMRKPLARREQLVSEPIGEELLVYDRERQTAHSLNHIAAAVWKACDGTRDERAIATACNLDAETVTLTLSELAAIDLLDGYQAPRTGISRRHMLRRAALAGAGVGLALPVIRSVVATPEAYASTGAATCGGGQAPGTVHIGLGCTSTCSCATSCCCHSGNGGDVGMCTSTAVCGPIFGGTCS